jgi:hypothetical protein
MFSVLWRTTFLTPRTLPRGFIEGAIMAKRNEFHRRSTPFRLALLVASSLASAFAIWVAPAAADDGDDADAIVVRALGLYVDD